MIKINLLKEKKAKKNFTATHIGTFEGGKG
jgi:hypothetical protein